MYHGKCKMPISISPKHVQFSVKGRVVFASRGRCPFTDKISFLHRLGAAAVVIMNNDVGLIHIPKPHGRICPLPIDHNTAAPDLSIICLHVKCTLIMRACVQVFTFALCVRQGGLAENPIVASDISGGQPVTLVLERRRQCSGAS